MHLPVEFRCPLLDVARCFLHYQHYKGDCLCQVAFRPLKETKIINYQIYSRKLIGEASTLQTEKRWLRMRCSISILLVIHRLPQGPIPC